MASDAYTMRPAGLAHRPTHTDPPSATILNRTAPASESTAQYSKAAGRSPMLASGPARGMTEGYAASPLGAPLAAPAGSRADTLGEALDDTLPLALPVGVWDAVWEWEGDRDRLCVREGGTELETDPLALGVPLSDAVADAVPTDDGDGGGLAAGEPVALALPVPLSVSEGGGVPLCDALPVVVADAVGPPVPDDEAPRVREEVGEDGAVGEPVTVGHTDAVLDCVPVPDGERVVEPVGAPVAEVDSAGSGVRLGVDVPLPVAALDALPVPLPVPAADALGGGVGVTAGEGVAATVLAAEADGATSSDSVSITL